MISHLSMPHYEWWWITSAMSAEHVVLNMSRWGEKWWVWEIVMVREWLGRGPHPRLHESWNAHITPACSRRTFIVFWLSWIEVLKWVSMKKLCVVGKSEERGSHPLLGAVKSSPHTCLQQAYHKFLTILFSCSHPCLYSLHDDFV